MISQEQNDLMTRVGPGTPAGKPLREAMGPAFVNYYCHIKQAEVERFNLENKDAADDREVSEWEHREYFDLL